MDGFYLGIGSRIKRRRLALKLTREKLAFMANISDKFLYDIETGNKGMSAETLYKIKSSLNVSADWLLDGIVNDSIVTNHVTTFLYSPNLN
jgi:transcriptional regulator with XRE-family HTH domain